MQLPSGVFLSINHFCITAPSLNASMLPTIWFEADAAHGVTDFLGVQSILANANGRNSCSYDSPNFGFSARLPSSEYLDLTAIHSPLVAALGRTTNPRYWSDGVLEGKISYGMRFKMLTLSKELYCLMCHLMASSGWTRRGSRTWPWTKRRLSQSQICGEESA